jgi:hypothetical protein
MEGDLQGIVDDVSDDEGYLCLCLCVWWCGERNVQESTLFSVFPFPLSDDEADQKYIAEAARDQDKKVHEPVV